MTKTSSFMTLLQKLENCFEKRFSSICVLLITFLALIAWFFIYFGSNQEKKVEHALEVEATSVDRLLKGKMQNSFSIVEAIAVRISKNPRNLYYVENVLDNFQLTSQMHNSLSWTNFSWANANYIIKERARKGRPAIRFDLSIRDYIEHTKNKPGQFHVGSPVYGATSKRWLIPSGLGLVNKRGKYIGAVVGGFDIESMARSLQDNLIDKNIRVDIVDKSGTYILSATSEYIEVEHNKKIDNNDFLLETITSLKEDDFRSIIDVTCAADGKSMLIKKLDSFPFYLVLTYKQDAIVRSCWNAIMSRSFDIFVMLVVSIILLIVVFNIEERRHKKLIRIKEIADRVSETKDRIIFSITHDIKNYIFGLGGLAHMVIDSKTKQQIVENEDLQIVETMCDQIEELKYFVEDLLDTNQMESGGFAPGNIKNVDVKTMIDIVLAFSKSVASDNDILIKRQIANNLPKLRCDSRRVKQILINIISNAVKYSRPKSEVLVRAKHLRLKDQICIEVIDSGFGMSDEDLKKYMKGQGAKIDKSDILKIKDINSSGLGMQIVHKLVNMMEAQLEVESHQDLGTTVRVYFNLSHHKVKERAVVKTNKLVEISEDEKSVNSDKLILLVEDNPVNIKITCRILEKQGYRVIYAENGRDALETIEKECPDLILMDGEMPIMNGYDATRNIRKGTSFKNFTHFKDIPIIGLMSSADDKTIKRALDAGMVSHIEKSTSSTKLLMEIRRYLKLNKK